MEILGFIVIAFVPILVAYNIIKKKKRFIICCSFVMLLPMSFFPMGGISHSVVLIYYGMYGMVYSSLILLVSALVIILNNTIFNFKNEKVLGVIQIAFIIIFSWLGFSLTRLVLFS